MSELISGKEAKLAWANGESVEFYIRTKGDVIVKRFEYCKISGRDLIFFLVSVFAFNQLIEILIVMMVFIYLIVRRLK